MTGTECRAMRKACGITIVELARRAQVSGGFIYTLEHGLVARSDPELVKRVEQVLRGQRVTVIAAPKNPRGRVTILAGGDCNDWEVMGA